MNMQFVEMCNQKAQERKAIEYSKSVRKRNTKKTVLSVLVGVFLCSGIVYVSNEEFESVQVHAAKATTEFTTETEETYLICDIDNYVYNADLEGTTELGVSMPNGDYIWYEVTDAPEGKCKLVVFKTNDLENYKAYEVVALR